MLIARTFSPLLFRLGPQPFPSLLFQALKGELDDLPEEAFIQLCADTEKRYKKKNLLKDALWECSSCKKELPWTAYFVKGSDKEWDKQYEDRICRPGALRECHECNPWSDVRMHECTKCGISKPQDAYSRSQWHNKLQRLAKCLQCEKLEDLLKCSICHDTKPSSAFSPSAIKNISQRIFRCYDCSRPPCMFIPKCTTCTKCRDEKCKKGARCTKSIETLNSKLLPATAEEVQKYACDKCRYVRCIVMKPDGSICGKERRANAKAKARRDKTDYKCGDCLTWLLSQDTLRKAAASTRSAN